MVHSNRPERTYLKSSVYLSSLYSPLPTVREQHPLPTVREQRPYRAPNRNVTYVIRGSRSWSHQETHPSEQTSPHQAQSDRVPTRWVRATLSLPPVRGLSHPSIPLPFHWREGTCSDPQLVVVVDVRQLHSSCRRPTGESITLPDIFPAATHSWFGPPVGASRRDAVAPTQP